MENITCAEDSNLFVETGVLHVDFVGDHLHDVVVVQFLLHIDWSPFSLLVFLEFSCPMDSSNVFGKLINMKSARKKTNFSQPK